AGARLDADEHHAHEPGARPHRDGGSLSAHGSEVPDLAADEGRARAGAAGCGPVGRLHAAIALAALQPPELLAFPRHELRAGGELRRARAARAAGAAAGL